MVSIRRRKLLGLCSGKSSFLAPLPRFPYNGHISGNHIQSPKPVSMHPLSSVDIEEPKEKATAKVGPISSHICSSSSSKVQHTQQFPVPELKRRKRHNRKLSGNQEIYSMRGVYFKNMKWQAAIKVDKKQIHLGTVDSQEEAARLYDRAAFMCGRAPNFELSEEEKRELSKFKWDEFLAITRSAINNKKSRRRTVVSHRKAESSTQNSNGEDEQEGYAFAGSEDIESDTYFSRLINFQNQSELNN